MNPTLLFVLGLFGLFAGLALALAAVGGLTTERRGVGRSLEAIEAISTAPSSLKREYEQPFADRVVVPMFEALGNLGKRMTPQGQRDKIRQRLEQAGNPVGWDVDRVSAFKVLAMLLFALLGLALPLLLGYALPIALAAAIVGAAGGFFLPNLLLLNEVQQRADRIQRDLPNALDLLTISVESGLSFDAALAQVARKTEGPLAEEFQRVLQEMQIGVGRTDAIRALGERTTVDDLRSFAGAMVQADVFGIPIANVLRVQSKEMRVKRRQRAEERAQKVPVKILFPLIFFILPTIFIVILGPAIIQLIELFTERI